MLESMYKKQEKKVCCSFEMPPSFMWSCAHTLTAITATTTTSTILAQRTTSNWAAFTHCIGGWGS